MATDKKMIDYLKKVSPGNPIRTVIDDLVRAGLGALIIFETPELYLKKIFEGGFKINCEFTPQKLFELCKLDGGVIISHDLDKILFANVLITPDNTISTNETGTRHKAAERCAKQADTFVIAVSERRKKTTLYLDNSSYYLKTSDELMRNITANLQVLEDQRSSFNELLGKLDILEISEMVSAIDVCRIIQKAELMIRINDDIKREIIEIGIEGRIINMRFKELTRGFEKTESEIIRDYATHPLKKTKTLLQNISFEELLDIETVSSLILEKNLEETITPNGYRFLSHLELTDKEISDIVKKFNSLDKILDLEEKELEAILKDKYENIKKEIENLREQILSGKDVT